MSWSVSVFARLLLSWPRRRAPRPASLRQRAPYRDAFFASPAAVEDDYRRLSRTSRG
jgi:hypothetical protein